MQVPATSVAAGALDGEAVDQFLPNLGPPLQPKSFSQVIQLDDSPVAPLHDQAACHDGSLVVVTRMLLESYDS